MPQIALSLPPNLLCNCPIPPHYPLYFYSDY